MALNFRRYDVVVDHYSSMWPLLMPGYVPICNAMLDVVWSLSQRPAEILDLGCGPGTATVAVAPASHPDGMVTLVDGSPRMVAAAKKLLGNHVRCSFIGDFTDPAVLGDVCPEQRYDLILSSFALHHIDSKEKRLVISKLADALKPGALLMIADEVAIERPGGRDIVERIRSRIVDNHLKSGRLTRDFWQLETQEAAKHALPFLPARVDDLISLMANAGLAVSCPVNILGNALLLGFKNEESPIET